MAGRFNPLTLAQQSAVVVRKHVYELHEGVARLPYPLKRYVASCVLGYARQYRTKADRAVFQCTRCACTLHSCNDALLPGCTVFEFYRFEDSDALTQPYICFCCGWSCWTAERWENDDFVAALVLTKAVDHRTATTASMHSGYSYYC